MSIKERFKAIRRDLNLNQEAFGFNLGTNQVGITDIERGRKNLSIEVMEILHKKFYVNLNWLICGTGSIKYNYNEIEKENESKPEFQSNLKMVIDALRETIEAQKETNEAHKRTITALEARITAYENKYEKQANAQK
jgi:transcriptional regulator with XRE-family HTH domain